MVDRTFSDRVAIVTGGTRGIGAAIANALAKRGCRVFVTGTADKFNEQLQHGQSYIPLRLENHESVEHFYRFLSSLDSLDILVNNAGINIIENIEELSDRSWDKVLDVNLRGPALISRASVNILKKSDSARILNVSSIWGIVGKEKRVAYVASKTGLIGLTRVLALDLAPDSILVNALCPGFTLTELTDKSLSAKEREQLSSEVPLGRFADVDEIAKIAVMLCSPDNTYMTGQAITVDGGYTIR